MTKYIEIAKKKNLNIEYYKFKEFIVSTLFKMNDSEKNELKKIIEINMYLYNNYPTKKPVY